MSWGDRKDAKTVTDRMRALLDEICQSYDFGRFTMDSFVEWVEQRLGCKIVFVAWPMPDTVFGGWVATADRSYIFFERDTLPLHQGHIQLHELAHMLCGHTTAVFTDEQIHDLLRREVMDDSALLRTNPSDPAEQEAETLSTLIQELVLRHARLRELSVSASSHENLARIYEDLGLLE